MTLYYRETGQGQPLIILHGLFGAGDNWLSVARLLEEEYRVILPDARNHGQSPHDAEFTYSAMASDLVELLDELGLPDAIFVGHSMGGKAVMNLAVSHPGRVRQLVVVDIAPRFYPVHHQTILQAFSAIDLQQLKSRKEADEAMAVYIRDVGTRQFLLKNLTRSEGGQGFEWKINLPVIREKIENVGEPLPEGAIFDKPTLFIGGANSDYIRTEDEGLIRQHFPQAKVVSIAGAGHWVHAEKPQEVVAAMKGFFSENA
ncbi:alpha/beta fold hydrolase [Cesiribacter andamanensis]|uniref:Esterase ybfF n=1 Tax=Cesiribacter andamanensis AMV16 TaxID=1279009 RepID=M7N946_9BACT|nr:alpha/beta fold hydrolase [Cesiribacter andamanensis]EMR03757.1 Esterase ybfF [Cesiribacter andamanensis AMV16]